MKRFYLFMAAWAIAVGVAACSSIQTVSSSTQTQQIETACESGAMALKALAIVAPSIPKVDLQRIAVASATVTPLCTSQAIPTYTTVEFAALTAAVSTLTSLETTYAPPQRSQ
jgi:hypothetical protein